MNTSSKLALALVGVMAISLTTEAWAKSPRMKQTTPIPPEITTPDKVETRLGTLHFENGMPDQATIQKVYDNLDFSRAVDWIDGLPTHRWKLHLREPSEPMNGQ